MFLDSCWILVPGVICDPFVLYLPLLLQLTGTPRPANWKSSVTTVSDWLATSCLSVCNFKSQRIFCSQPFLVPSPITAWKFLIHMWNKCCQIWIRSCHLLTTIPDFWLWLGVDCPNCILHVLDSLWGTLAQSWDLWLGLMPSYGSAEGLFLCCHVQSLCAVLCQQQTNIYHTETTTLRNGLQNVCFSPLMRNNISVERLQFLRKGNIPLIILGVLFPAREMIPCTFFLHPCLVFLWPK